MEEEGPSVRWAELSVQGAGEGLLASYGSGEAERPAAIISGLGLPSHPSGVAKCHVGKAQVNPGIILGESLVSEASMEFLASTSAVLPAPSGTKSHFTDADNWVLQLPSGGVGI